MNKEPWMIPRNRLLWFRDMYISRLRHWIFWRILLWGIFCKATGSNCLMHFPKGIIGIGSATPDERLWKLGYTVSLAGFSCWSPILLYELPESGDSAINIVTP